MKRYEKALATYKVYERERERIGYKDYSVAKETGLRPSTLCDWKHGRCTPGTEKLIKIAALLDIPVTAFYEGM